MFLKSIRLFIFLLNFSGYFTRQGYAENRDGNRCVRQHDNAYGTCRKLRECPKVVEDYTKYQISPQFCDFGIDIQIVCCPNYINVSDNVVHRTGKFDDSDDDDDSGRPSLDILLQNAFALKNRKSTASESSSTISYYFNDNTNRGDRDNVKSKYENTKKITSTTSTTQRNKNNDYAIYDGYRQMTETENRKHKEDASDLIDEALSRQPPPLRSLSTDRPKRRYSGTISLQKCEEYKKLSKKIILFSPLLVEPTPIQKEVPLCDATTPLIVGGDITKPGEFPSMAVLGYRNGLNDNIRWKCGGTLISERFVLTAAHCVKKVGDRPTIVRLGEQNLATVNDGAQATDYTVDELFIHPDYKISSYYHDIAIIRLNKDVEFNGNIRPACLWQTHNINATKAIATGWGTTGFMNDQSTDLLKVDLNFYTNQECQQHYSLRNDRKLLSGIISEQLCAGFADQEKDTCQGDSGGPLFVIFPDNPCIHHITGITSFGSFCGGATPGVYTRVSSYIDWIESIVW